MRNAYITNAIFTHKHHSKCPNIAIQIPFQLQLRVNTKKELLWSVRAFRFPPSRLTGHWHRQKCKENNCKMPLDVLTSTFFLVFSRCWRRSGGRFGRSTFNASRRRHYACNIATNASINTAHSAAKHPVLMASLRWRFNYFCNRIIALFPHRLHLHQLQGCGLIDLCKAQIGYIMHLYRHCTGNQTTRSYHTVKCVSTPELFTYSFIINFWATPRINLQISL